MRVLSDLATLIGRDNLVRAMARSPEYRERWRLFLSDFLRTPRLNEQANAECYGRPILAAIRPDLAEHVRDHGPEDAPFGQPFTMADLARSSLTIDDLSPVLRANLLMSLWREFEIPDLAGAQAYRDGRVGKFTKTYLGRDLECTKCHNSEFSTTGDPDPRLDRTWEIPGRFEKALFGDSAGSTLSALRPFFRRWGVVAGAFYDTDFDGPKADAEIAAGVQPWGSAPVCGVLIAPDARRPEDLGDSPFLIQSYGQDASILDLETQLRAGLLSLRDGLRVDPDLSVEGPSALAWLVSASLANAVFVEAYGASLVLPHGFARNQAQRDVQETLAERFATSGYSLVELLVEITARPEFAAAEPSACEPAASTGFPALFDPWDKGAEVASTRRNTLGDQIHRLPPRTLRNAAAVALGWRSPSEFHPYFTMDEAQLQRRMGIFLKPADPGFRGTSFQSLLAFEDDFGPCRDPAADAECSVLPIVQDTRKTVQCLVCAADPVDVCDWDPRCCDESYRAGCPDSCEDALFAIDFPNYPPLDTTTAPDFIDRLLAEANGRPLEDAVVTLRDRILASPLSSEEPALVEALLGATLRDPVTPSAEEGLRRLCGVWLEAPDFQLTGLGDSREAAVSPALGPSYAVECDRLVGELQLSGQLACAADRVELR